jgi:hypothetical protein
MKPFCLNISIYSIVMAIFVILIGSCSGGGGGGGSKKVSATISAAAGGTISQGDLTLDIPAGALAEDTEITIRKINPADLPGEFSELDADTAYQLSPDGLEFSVPITVSIKLDEKPVQPDGSLSFPLPPLLITSSDGELELLDDITMVVDGDTDSLIATGELTHFSYTVTKKAHVVGGFPTEVNWIKVTVADIPETHPVDAEPFSIVVTAFNELEGEAANQAPELLVSYLDKSSIGISTNTPKFDMEFETPEAVFYSCDDVGRAVYLGSFLFDATEPFIVPGIEGNVELFLANIIRSLTCVAPPPEEEGGNGESIGMTFPNMQFSAVGTFTFKSVGCGLNFGDFTDDSYLFTTLGGDLTIFQGSTLDTANGLIDANGNFTAQQLKDGLVIEDYTNGKCTTTEPFSCTADYMYLATDPETQEPCPAFWNAAFALDPVMTF